MRFALAVSAACFAYLRCVCLVQFPAGATAVSVSTCSAAAASATSTGTSAATIIDVDGAGAGCDGLTEPFTGTPGTARERSFFVSGGSSAKVSAVVSYMRQELAVGE